MRLTSFGIRGALVLVGTAVTAGPIHSQQAGAAPAERPRFWQAAASVVAINGLTWAYNWYVQGWHWANVGTRAWWKNVRDGFTWDDDAFMDNQLAHPYHGSYYFNAARTSRYGFWGSSAYTAVGSLTWELLSENVHPSLNDLINTTLGGIALGEVTYRLSTLLTAGNGSGRDGLGRQAGAFVLSPIGQVHGLLGGGKNSKPAGPSRLATGGAWITLGRHTGGEVSGAGAAAAPSRSFAGFSFRYGLPFAEGPMRPYDAFEFSLQLSPEESGVITNVAVSGLLARRLLRTSDRDGLLLGLYQHYDYEAVSTFKLSSQSLSGALLYRRFAGPGARPAIGLHLEAIPLAAVSSDHNAIRNRNYDYGPGLGGRLTASIQRGEWDLLRLDGRIRWIQSVYGADGEHVVTSGRLSATLPLSRMVGLGGDVGLTYRRSVYRDQPRVLKRLPQVRAYLIWSPS